MRPSSGTARLVGNGALMKSDASARSVVAAPEDGRTPITMSPPSLTDYDAVPGSQAGITQGKDVSVRHPCAPQHGRLGEASLPDFGEPACLMASGAVPVSLPRAPG